MTTNPLELRDMLIIGDNPGWRFGIARLGERWIGYAREGEFTAKKNAAFRESGLEVDPPMLFILPEVSEGFEMGVPDRECAILLTGAIAQDPESCYGGVERWFVPPELRGDPKRFRCPVCERIGCECEY